MRATVEQALGRVQEYITALEDESVPTSLLRERVKAIRAWGVGVKARGSRGGGGSKSQQIRNIQDSEQLDKMKDSEMYVLNRFRFSPPSVGSGRPIFVRTGALI